MIGQTEITTLDRKMMLGVAGRPGKDVETDLSL